MSFLVGCPVLQDTRNIQGLSHDLAKSIRKLRRDLKACESCPSYDECAVLKEFNSLVQSAINEVSAEWDQTSTPEGAN
jgi:hypothetical protein